VLVRCTKCYDVSLSLSLSLRYSPFLCLTHLPRSTWRTPSPTSLRCTPQPTSIGAASRVRSDAGRC
jgi:hypothetical protein